MVEAVDAAFGVDGEDGLAAGFLAERGDVRLQGAAEVAEGAGEVEAVQRVEGEGGGGDVAAGPGGVDVQAAELGPRLDGGGEDGVPVSGGEVWVRRASAQCSACCMSQRPGRQPASWRAASTATGKRVAALREWS